MTDQPSHAQQNAIELILHNLGPVAAYLDDPRVTEIMANDDGKVFVESHQEGMHDSGLHLTASARATIVNTVASINGDVITPENPEVAGVLPKYGARFQGVIPPACVAPAFAIRMPSARVITLEEYVASGTLTQQQAQAILWGLEHRKNFLVAGGTGSGKTTLANAILARLKDSPHRIMTIEDTPELRCEAPNRFQCFVDRNTEFDYQKALFVALRMRPDRIVVGELRDGLASLELLKAWNTGHSGGLATLHANSAKAALPRLEQLLQEVTKHTPRALIAEAIDIVLYVERYERTGEGGQKERARRVREVARVSSDLGPDQAYQLHSITHPSLGAT